MTREELIDELILANDENQILQAELDERDKTLNLADVVGRSEQLKAFREWWNKDNKGVCTTITHKDIERYLKSL